MEGEVGQPSNTPNYDSTSFPSNPGVPLWVDLSFPCTTWEEVRRFLLLWQVPATHLPYWEVLWRWDQLKVLVASQQIDRGTLDQRSMAFCRRIGGTKEDYECLVPERDGRMGTICEKIIGRQDRMRSHIRSDHLAGPGFPCGGRCGNNDCGQVFRQLRYVEQHVNPAKERCSQCGKVIYSRNMSIHRC